MKKMSWKLSGVREEFTCLQVVILGSSHVSWSPLRHCGRKRDKMFPGLKSRWRQQKHVETRQVLRLVGENAVAPKVMSSVFFKSGCIVSHSPTPALSP